MFARCDEELFEVNGVHIEVNPVLIAKKDGLLTLGFGKGLVELCNPVSYTHLTLPTKLEV